MLDNEGIPFFDYEKAIKVNDKFLERLHAVHPKKLKPIEAEIKPVKFPDLNNPYFKGYYDQYNIQSEKQIITARDKFNQIVSMVAYKHGLKMSDILGRSRRPLCLQARYISIDEVIKSFPKFCLTQIARMFDRDHSTLLHANNKIIKLKNDGKWPPVFTRGGKYLYLDESK